MSNFLLKNPDVVLIHIPKTGGSTIRHGIWEGRYDGPIYGEIPHKWSDVLKISFVRHPLDRLASAYRDFSQHRGFSGDFATFLSIVVDDSIPYVNDPSNIEINIRHHTIPQTHPFNCLIYADYIGRFEHYKKDVTNILEILRLDKKEIPKLRSTLGSDYESIIQKGELRQKAIDYYKEDFVRLGYQFEGCQ